MFNPTNDLNSAKKAVGEHAATLVEDGMIIGLGTGSTAAYFIHSLIERCRQGLNITAIATSKRSEQLAREGGIPIADIEYVTSLDLAIDGADQIDAKRRLIKGGGGALLREKIIASMSKEFIVIADQAKVVTTLAGFPLPVEVIPFGYRSIVHQMELCGYQGRLRLTAEGELYRTDNNNYIFDIVQPERWSEPEKDDRTLRSIPGVVETGFFLNMAGRIFIGYEDGKVQQI